MKHISQAGFGTALIIAIIAVIALGGGFYYVSQQSEQTAETTQHNETDLEMMKEKAEMEDNGSRETADMEAKADVNMEAKDKGVMTDAGLMVDAETEIDTTFLPEPKAGTFDVYSDGSLALANEGDVVLFFHAPWCPSCRALESDIEANLSSIPPNVHLLKVDYDSATELKKKYGVVRQHTLVQVDSAGNEIQTLTGLVNTLDQVISQL